MTSSFVLPWIGGPSSSSSPGRIRNLMIDVRTTAQTITKIGTEKISRTSHSVSIGPACLDAAFGNQLIESPRAMPSAVATPLITITRISVPEVTLARGRAPVVSGSLGSGSMPAESYVLRAMDAVLKSACRVADGAAAKRRRRDAVTATKCLGELRGLAVADAACDVVHTGAR